MDFIGMFRLDYILFIAYKYIHYVCCTMDVAMFDLSNRIDDCVYIYLIMCVIWNYPLAQTAPRVPYESLSDLSSNSKELKSFTKSSIKMYVSIALNIFIMSRSTTLIVFYIHGGSPLTIKVIFDAQIRSSK